MKLYMAQAPNALRVAAFLKEKGIGIPVETVEILKGGTRTPAFLKVNSLGEIPVLELDDGTRISESMAICRYLDALYPETPLTGSNPLSAAKIEMWSRRMELRVAAPIDAYARHTFAFFADKVDQVAAFAKTQIPLQAARWKWLDDELSDGRTFLADDTFSVADITGRAALMVCDFAGEGAPGDDLVHVKRWENAVRSRPCFA